MVDRRDRRVRAVPGPPSLDERAALPDQILELLRTSVAVDTRVLSAFRRPLLPEQVQVILDGIDGIGPDGPVWPDPGTQPRRAWTMKLLRSLELTLVEVLPTALLLELLRDHPGPLLTLGLHSGDVCARLAQVLPDAPAAWTGPRDQWDGFLAALKVRPWDQDAIVLIEAAATRPGPRWPTSRTTWRSPTSSRSTLPSVRPGPPT